MDNVGLTPIFIAYFSKNVSRSGLDQNLKTVLTFAGMRKKRKWLPLYLRAEIKTAKRAEDSITFFVERIKKMTFFSQLLKKQQKYTKLGKYIAGLNEENISKTFSAQNNFHRNLSTVYSYYVLILANGFFLKLKETFDNPTFGTSKFSSLWEPPPFQHTTDGVPIPDDHTNDEKFLWTVINQSYDLVIYETAAFFHFHFMRDFLKREYELEEEGDYGDVRLLDKEPYYSALHTSIFKTNQVLISNTSFNLTNDNFFHYRCDGRVKFQGVN